jgi:hypothetical protein
MRLKLNPLRQVVKIILLTSCASFFISCGSLGTEGLSTKELNINLLKAEYPEAEIYPIKGFSYIFRMHDVRGVYTVHLDSKRNITIDTSRVFKTPKCLN